VSRKQLEARLARRIARDPLARTLKQAALETGVATWLVGGVVRDAALERKAADLDAVAGPRTLRLVRRLEQSLGHRGFRFRKRGVTTWRFAAGPRRIDIVDLGRRTLREDLLRRELTINAVAFDLVRLEIVDPLAGLADLRRGRLRLPRPGVMREDPLRALRLARFASTVPAARIDPGARTEALLAGPRLARAAVERVREELERILSGPAPHRALELAHQLDLVAPLLPELAPMARCVAGRDRPDVWRHTLDVLASSTRPARLACPSPRGAELKLLRWSLLLHDIAKPETLAVRDDGTPTFHGHEVLGARRVRALLARLRLPRKERRRIEHLVALHLRPGHLADAGAPPRGLRRLARDAGDDLPLLVLHAVHDARGSGSPDGPRRLRRLRRVLFELLRLHEQRGGQPQARLVDGHDVLSATGLEPGPLVGRILRSIREAQEEGVVRDRTAALDLARRLAQAAPRLD
jgi:poly(A) polymerase